MKIQNGSKLLLIGDSITDCERAHPVGEGLFQAEGKGYVSIVKAYLTAVCPERKIRVVNMGTSGNTVKDLAARWKTDCLDLKPDWVSIMIGVNDVWRQHDLPLQPETHVSLKEYTRTLEQIVVRTKSRVKGLILMTPFYIEPSSSDSMRAMMNDYGRAVKQIARKHGAICIDTQAAFDAVLAHLHANAIAWDRVHPNTAGHMVIARAFLNAIGLKF
ncbi:SGNH/GDSL hydrolase family protein [Oscillatoria amoena NRMC-F 0135]|nr:SGNH/GDSL hydrolase family protein [Oscillatoria laete-virens]MDL5045797.1 SGNH/GDSL hydrolase family protein [Oscillatoria amoena NRMC-F 0135]MDL5055168.1 SGNH/GDSL hydrolase family protein [Oscillatoria laete-virens NRMC-F 0139]